MRASPFRCGFWCLALWWFTNTACRAVEPLAVAGTEHTAVVHALMSLARGDTDSLLALPGHVLADAPAITDPDDPALARRWTTLLPNAVSRLPAAQKKQVLIGLDAHYAQARALGGNAQPWDFLPAPAAATIVSYAADVAFDHGLMRKALTFLALGANQEDPRQEIARNWTQAPLPRPALPAVYSGLPMPPAALIHGDGWLFGMDPAGRVSWQRRCERQAHVVIGDSSALLVETAGAAVIDHDGHAHRLPPLPSFAKPWAITDHAAWFVAGTRCWRVILYPTLAIAELTLSEPPLGPPVLRGDDAWWLTREELIMTHGTTIVEHLPHLLVLSPLAGITPHPLGAVIRDGTQTWLVADRDQSPPMTRGASWLLAGEPVKARSFSDLSHVGEELAGQELAFRCVINDPDATVDTFIGAALTPQQYVIAWLAGWRKGNFLAEKSLIDLARLHPDLLTTEPTTNLALPISAWPLRTTLAAWDLRHDLQAPVVDLHSDACRVQVRATWPDHSRWWERTWPTRPLLDAPSRTWVLTDGAVVIADGADHLVLLDQATGNIILSADVPGDLDPATVVRYGSTRAAMLSDQGRTVLILDQKTVTRIPLSPPGRRLRCEKDTVIVVTDANELRLP